jgi:septal ring factor EnvC (AmiA/AmiB activator)
MKAAPSADRPSSPEANPMRRLLLLACCAAVVPLGVAFADDDPDPEPRSTNPDGDIKKLDDAISGKKANAETVEKQRKQLVERLKKEHAALVKRRQDKKALAMKERLLAESLKPGQGLDTKLTVPKLLEKASSNGRYKDLLHVLYLPGDKASYKDFTDYGFSATDGWGGYQNLTHGHWVYVYPRWYIWKELK